MTVVYRRSAQRVLWGDDALDALPQELRRLGVHRPLILCGRSVAAHARLVPRVLQLLAGAAAGVSSDVRAHSPVQSVEDVAASLASTGADSIIAVGGGSAFVTARAACIRHGEGAPLEQLATRRTADGEVVSPRLLAPKLPIIAVPTTPTTAAGKAGTAVTVAGQGERLTMLDPGTRARSILLDPEFLASAPDGLVADAALNAMVMAVEGLCTARTHLFADAALIHAVRQLTQILPSLAGAASARHRMDSALVALLVGEGTDSTGGGLTAALSHTIGHRFHAHNGSVDAVLLPHVLEHVPPSESARAAICAGLSVDPAEMVDALAELFAASGAPTRLRDVGVEREDLETLAVEATADVAFGRGRDRHAPGTVSAILNAAW